MKDRRFLNSIAALSAALTFTGQLTAATYTQDFSGFADGTTDLADGSVMAGTANVLGEQLELTRDGVAGGGASFSIPALADSSLGWTATFDLTISDSAGDNEPADGFSMNYGNADLGEIGSAEEGMDGVAAVTENLSFEIDTWMNTDAEQGVNIGQKVAGVVSDVAFTNGSILADGTTVMGEVEMRYAPGAGVSFTTTGLLTNAAFAIVPTDFVGDDAYTFIISGRVGGANQTVLIDNLVIVTAALDDADGDGLPDDYEIANMLDPDDNGLNPNNNGVPGDPNNGAAGDPDLDTLTNIEERDLGTNPQEKDTDSDGIDDNVENNNGVWAGTAAPGTDPTNPDSDGDLLSDGVENPDIPHNPMTPDTEPGTDPNIADSDGDGLVDGYEVNHFLNPDDNGLNPNNNGVAGDPNQGADGDPDLDTLSNTIELGLGTHPNEKDTDSDGYDDNVETNSGTWTSVADTGSDPIDDDSDDDDLLDGVENPDLPYDPMNAATQPGTDPNIRDTDGDTVSDGEEVAAGRNPTVFQAPPSGYFQDFDDFADGTIDLGDGTQMNGTAEIIDGKLRLTADGVAGGGASFMVPAIANSETGWTATFDLEISDSSGANEPADGLSFNYGNFALTELGSAEEGMAGAGAVSENISFEIDTWMNSDAEQGVNIAEKVGGVDLDLAFTGGSILADGTMVSGVVTAVFDPDEGLSFTTTGLLTNADFENVIPTFIGNEAYNFGLSARVGGANQTVLINNLEIQVGKEPESFKIIGIEKVFVPANEGDPDSYSITIIWQSKENRTYKIFTSPDMEEDALADWGELDDAFPGAIGQTTTSFTERLIPVDTKRRFYRVQEAPR